MAVRSFTLRGPLGVVAAGSRAALEVGPIDRSSNFAVSRFGDPEVIRSGERIGGRFRVSIPGNTRTGVYLVRVRAGRHRAVVAAGGGRPSAEPARRRAPAPARRAAGDDLAGPEPVDDDLDGFADTLPAGGPVASTGRFATEGSRRSFASETAPLLRYLEREGLAYDLTTDLSLARREGPALGNAPGVAFAGSALWLTEPLLRRLRNQVSDGLGVASFGVDAFRRSVKLAWRAAGRSQPAAGARTPSARRRRCCAPPPRPLTVFDDGLGLFEGLDSFVGDFTEFEQSQSLPSDARTIATAGRDPGQPAFVAYGLGGGLVIRTGTPQWSGRAGGGGAERGGAGRDQSHLAPAGA